MNRVFDKTSLAGMVVEVETAPTFKPGNPRDLFRGTYFSIPMLKNVTIPWDIHPDGKRFLMIKVAGSPGKLAVEAPRKINIVLNWFEELKQKVQVGK